MTLSSLTLMLAVAVLVVLSVWLHSPVMKIVSGIASLGFGANFISTDPESYIIIIIGVAFLILGLYQMLTSFRR